ncbi:FliO/MopB family protein [Glaciibacter superstes]|uniref:FliO/MopB family protein n=1 Tax=Glaciibacter superstes TaxID=501023 RepID=UPI0003B5649C|nr:flagellar biosynthetic protein FliO [Glaciibacter superstes]
MDVVFIALRVALSLAVVLGLLWYVQRRWARKGGRRAAANIVTVVGRQGIGQKASVVVVDIEGSRFILGVTEASVNVLHSNVLPDDESTASAFAASLQDAARDQVGIEPPLAFRPRRPRHAPGKLGGSILSPTTWQQTATVLRQGR